MTAQIRDLISDLRAVRDDLITYARSRSEVEEAMRSIHASDAEGVYATVVQAHQLLGAARAADARDMLDAARGRAAQVQSELVGGGDEGKRLAGVFMAAFDECEKAIGSAVAVLLLGPVHAPAKACVPRGATAYDMPCSVCSKVSVTLEIGRLLRGGGDHVVYRGITKSTEIDRVHAPQLFEMLERGAIGEVHRCLRETLLIEDGIDGYCPECDRIYCRVHYSVREVYDDGFYDCAHGTCPVGHTRIIDD